MQQQVADRILVFRIACPEGGRRQLGQTGLDAVQIFSQFVGCARQEVGHRSARSAVCSKESPYLAALPAASTVVQNEAVH